MPYSHETELGLVLAAALVNTAVGREGLTDLADLDAFLLDHPMTGLRRSTHIELQAVRDLRPELRAIWDARDTNVAAELVNMMRRQTQTSPYLSRHDALDWHLHFTDPRQPLDQRIAAESAMAFADLVRYDDLSRLSTCAGEDCGAVLIDLSKNRSRRFCNFGNCGNRTHVAAYRQRQRTRH